VKYIIKKNKRSRNLRIIVHADGHVVVTAPMRAPLYLVKKFVESRSSWIEERVENFRKKMDEKEKENEMLGIPKKMSRAEQVKDYKKYKESAREFVEKRIVELNKFYNFEYGKIAIRNQSTRWGSCSRKKNLNFNYKIVKLPSNLADYIIVHELCHLAHFNHSANFWELVARVVPDHKDIRRQLHKMGLMFD
jgi:predicted metal-dependent hydrolase